MTDELPEMMVIIQKRYEKAAEYPEHRIYYNRLTKGLVEEWPLIRAQLQAGEQLAEAAGQCLDDMGKDGKSVCQITKEWLQNALTDWEDRKDWK